MNRTIKYAKWHKVQKQYDQDNLLQSNDESLILSRSYFLKK